MDPHKGLGLPYGTGAVLVKQGCCWPGQTPTTLITCRMQSGPFTMKKQWTSPADFSLELTRPFRGPRMWFPLKLFGLNPFRARSAEKIWLARYFHQALGKLEGFETGPYPDLSIVTFRYLPASGDINRLQQALDGSRAPGWQGVYHFNPDRREFTLRLAVLNFPHAPGHDRLPAGTAAGKST